MMDSVLKPFKLGSKKIPDGYIRLFHYTKGDPDSIRKQGLLLEKAQGSKYGEPDFVWASNKSPDPDIKNIVEFKVPANDPAMQLEAPKTYNNLEEWNNGTRHVGFTRNITPDEIIQIHEPWHSKLEYIMKDPRLLEEIIAGKHDGLLENMGKRFPDEAKAINYIKKNWPNLAIGSMALGASSFISPERANAESLQEPMIDPTTLLAGPARWGGGLMNMGVDSLMRYFTGGR